VAAALKDTLSLESDLMEGARGEFTVWVNDTCVAKKDEHGFPEDAAVVAAVRRELGQP